MDAAQETEYAGELQASRNASSDVAEDASRSREAAGPKPISVMEGLLFAAFIFVFFDAPQYIIDFFSLGFGFVINWIIALAGWAIIYLWMFAHGHRIMSGPKKNWQLMLGFGLGDMLPLIPGLAGFVITFTLRDRVSGTLKNAAPGAPI